MGCWQPLSISEDQTSLAHTCFIPNAFFTAGLIANFGLWALGRVQLARRALGAATKLTMREILEARART
jgi:hypothetical protein